MGSADSAREQSWPNAPGSSAAELFRENVRRSRGRGIATVSTAGWSAGAIIAFLVGCGGEVENFGAEVRTVLIGTEAACKLGLPAVAGCPVLVGGLPGLVSDQIEADGLEIAFGPPGSAGLH